MVAERRMERELRGCRAVVAVSEHGGVCVTALRLMTAIKPTRASHRADTLCHLSVGCIVTLGFSGDKNTSVQM